MTQSPTLGFVIHDVARLMRKRFEQRARVLGLTRTQWQVLTTLAKHEGIHQNGLAELLDIESITLVRILDKMEEKHLVERQRHPTDRRIWQLHLLPQAQPLIETLCDMGQRTRDEALDGLDADQRETLFNMLTTMRMNLIGACDRPIEAETING